MQATFCPLTLLGIAAGRCPSSKPSAVTLSSLLNSNSLEVTMVVTWTEFAFDEACTELGSRRTPSLFHSNNLAEIRACFIEIA
ncbi:hypothetical protein Acr_06g0003330 [Actinidia rufa]|uniref:Uncharacterized protein n=1 Tax=Actinidia rufa TaxID=165716 RepID=A0A7J0EPN4_9ERIC|nr:hypothetical protein Acr_06g0003330 [Actinidia rufa]